MESNGQAGLEPRRAERGRTWAERAGEVQAYYTEVRRTGSCRRCGKMGYVRIGPHPEGRKGQPPKVCGADLEALKSWIEAAGWLCRGCSLREVVEAVPVAVVVVEKRPWEPYPVKWAKLMDELDREVEKMRSGSDGMGVRSLGDCAKHEANVRTLWRKNLGWVTPDEWFECHEKFVPAS